MKRMSIDIIMGSYNGEKYIREQIDSILGNTYTEWKLMIYDDGSVDNTEVVGKEYAKRFSGKIFFEKNENNLGVVKNFLYGAGKSSADYIMFCDQDDIWLDNKIGDTLKYIKSMEKRYGKEIPLCVFSDARVVDQELGVISESFFSSNKLDAYKTDIAHLMMENKLLGCTVMFNRSLKDKLTQIPENVKMHDWWIGLICASFGHIGFLDKSTMLYRQHGTNVIGNQSFRKYFLNRISSIKKQKLSLKENELQAEEFYSIYKEELSDNKKILVKKFSKLGRMNWIKRRVVIIKNGYLKTGIIRNAGVLLLI